MQPGGRTGKHLEMVTAKVGNYTLLLAVDEIDLRVARIAYLCSVDFQHYYLMLPHCHLGIVVRQTAHWLKPYWLSSVEIHSSTSSVNKEW